MGVGALATAGGAGAVGSVTADDSSDHYHNPVGPIGFGDPTVIEDGGTYYVYGTENPEDVVPIAQSDDLVNWEYIGAAFDEESKPDWHDDPDAGVWAPDINYHDGQYYLYYSLSTWGSDNAGIGLATADSPDGPFEDQGPVFTESDDLSPTNCIDQEFVVVDGTPYMVWGSWYGFYGVELTADGRDYVDGTVFQIGGEIGEGAMVVQENGYYYLFYSTGQCCEGYDSTYEVEVARSESFFGPYINQNGDDIANLSEHHAGVPILTGSDRFTGPGHNTAYRDENGDWWMIYHVEATTDQEDRILMADRIRWDSNDWPVIANDGRPSHESAMPGASDYYAAGPDDGPIETGTYRLWNANSEKLLEVASAGTSDGDTVQQWDNTGHDCQRWLVEDTGNGVYRIENVNSGKVLDVDSTTSGDGANVLQWADNGTDNQRFRIRGHGNGEYFVEAVHSGKVLDVEGASTDDGGNVIQWSRNDGANQRWRFEPMM